MSGPRTVREVKRLIAHYERDLPRRGAVTPQELEDVAARFSGRRLKAHEYWEWWADLRAYAKREAWLAAKVGDLGDADALEAAIESLEERAESVELPSLGLTVIVAPASWARIQIIEDHAMLEACLQGGRHFLLERLRTGKPIKARKAADVEICPKCERPFEVGDTADLLFRTEAELSYQRGAIYAQVTALGPQPLPVGSQAEWADRIVPEEHIAILQAYHRVNLERLRRMPKPAGKDKTTALPSHWSFLFARLSARENKPAAEIMRDRSLVAIVAVQILESRRDEIQRKEAKAEAKASGGSKTHRRAPRRARSPRRGR